MADIHMIRKKLAQFISESGHNYRELSLKIGRKDAYIQQYIKYGLPKRLNEVDRKKLAQILHIDERELLDDELLENSSNINPIYEEEEFSTNDGDYIKMDIFSPKADRDLYLNNIGSLSLNFLEFHALCQGNPYNLRIIKMTGDYMEPNIHKDSLVIYDTSKNSFIGDGVYVVQTENIVHIKRIQQSGSDKFILKADNPLYETQTFTADSLKFLGKVTHLLNAEPI